MVVFHQDSQCSPFSVTVTVLKASLVPPAADTCSVLLSRTKQDLSARTDTPRCSTVRHGASSLRADKASIAPDCHALVWRHEPPEGAHGATESPALTITSVLIYMLIFSYLKQQTKAAADNPPKRCFKLNHNSPRI